MLQKNKSKSTSKFKFLIILPLMLAMLTYVSCSSGKSFAAQDTPPPPPPPPPHAEQSTVVTEQPPALDPNLPIPFAVVEQVPIFPGCEDLTSQAEQKECFSQGINTYLNTNFNTSLGKELGLEGLTRVYVRFKISADGNITDVEARAPHPDLGEEAKRVINSLPKMEPAMQDGKKVAVLYVVPINFMVPQKTSEEGNADN